jgi:hypothetical protein
MISYVGRVFALFVSKAGYGKVPALFGFDGCFADVNGVALDARVQ